MASKKRSKEKRASDLVGVARKYFEGFTQYEIGESLGLTQQQISYDLKALRKQWMSQALQHITDGKAKELAEVDNLEITYWQAWRDSIGEHVVTTDRSGEDGESTTTKTENLLGDSRMLAGIQWCINKRCEILGLNIGGTTKNLNIDLSKLNDNQVQRLADGEDWISVITDSGIS